MMSSLRMLVGAHGDDCRKVTDSNHHQTCLRARYPVLTKHRLGCVAAEQEEEGVNVVHDEHKGGGHECQAHGLHAWNHRRIHGAQCSQDEDEELKLNYPPLILELELRLVWVGDDVGGALENVIIDRKFNSCRFDGWHPIRLLLEQRCWDKGTDFVCLWLVLSCCFTVFVVVILLHAHLPIHTHAQHLDSP